MTVRATPPRSNPALIAAHIEASHGIDRVRTLAPVFAGATPDTVAAILDEAARFSDGVLVPLNTSMDEAGVRLVDGQVQTAPGHRAAWEQFVAAGWPSLDHPEAVGGQELPLVVCLAVQELLDRGCPAFGMLAVSQRSAARLIAAFGDDTVKSELLPGLASGAIGATICISEAGAGSDLLQMRTRAGQDADGTWRLTGEKCWISFGDHDLTSRIVHCVLARTDQGGDPGAPEISLFLVEGGAAQGAAVATRRTEEKLGLHGSPTCALGFENARGRLLGTRGRGLQQMFVMITQMRLAVGAMGLGIATSAADTARAYAAERRQGGAPGAPVPIDRHRDVQRQLFDMAARVEMLRGLMCNTANLAEIAARSPDAAEVAEAGALVQWLLPIVKTFGGETAVATASDAIQVLGGAGYTRDWPVEQALRDARVLPVFEGTTGIQALDLVLRRVLRDNTGLLAFLAAARALGEPRLDACLDLLEDAAARIAAMDRASGDAEAGATAFLGLAILAAGGWVAAGLLRAAPADPARRHIAAAADYWLATLAPRAQRQHAEALGGSAVLAAFGDLWPE